MTYSAINIFFKRASWTTSIFVIVFSFWGLGTFSCKHYTKKNFRHEHEKKILVNKPIKDLALFPINAPRFRLSELENRKAIVFFMRDRNCRLSEKYGHFISQLEKKYLKKGILFVYNYVGRTNPKENSKRDLKKFHFKGPYLIDSRQTVSNSLSAQTTGEVFILTPKSRHIIYQGKINLPKPDSPLKNHFVSHIFEELLSGKKVIPRKILPAPGNQIVRPIIKSKVFWHDVSPIIQKKCTSCHNPSGSGPIDYLSYEDITGRKAMFKYVIENDLMPPWAAHSHITSFKNDISLTVYEKALLMKWLNTGLKRKIRKNVFPKIVTEKKNQQIIKYPDYVIKLPKQSKISATGFMPYQKFTVKTHFPEEKWIKEVEFILKPKVLHHVLFEICDSNNSYNSLTCRSGSSLRNVRNETIFSPLFVWAPGVKKYRHLPENTGIRIPKNAEIKVEMHYEPIGKEVIDDMTEIRFVFYKHPPKNQYAALVIRNKALKIPPEVSNYKNETVYNLKESVLLTAVSSHMHLRGKASSIVIIEPNGSNKVILNLDPYNFNFQRPYIFKEPVKVLKDSKIKCINWFDNSSRNLVNPNFKQTVLWGLKTTDEMSECWLSVTLPVSPNANF